MGLKRIEVKVKRELDINRDPDHRELGTLFELMNLEQYTRLVYDWGVHQGKDLHNHIIRDYDGWFMRGTGHRNELMEQKSDNMQPIKDRLRKLTEENIMLKQALKEVQMRMNIKVDIREVK